MPETCWESIDNKHLTVPSCWFSLSLHNQLVLSTKQCVCVGSLFPLKHTVMIYFPHPCWRLKKICPPSFRETCQWFKFPLNGLRTQSRVSPVVGLPPLASEIGMFRDGISSILGEIVITLLTRNSRIHFDRLQNKWTNCKGIKNNTNFGQITGIQGKLGTSCK